MLSGGFGFTASETGNNIVIDLDTSIYSGSGGIAVVVTDDQIILSGSSSDVAMTGAIIVSNVLSVHETTNIATMTSSYAQMGSLSGSITVSENSSIMIMFHATFQGNMINSCSLFRAMVDDVAIERSERYQIQKVKIFGAPLTWNANVNIDCVSIPLTAGAHSVAIQWATEPGTTAVCSASSEPTVYSAWLLATEMVGLP